MSLQVIGHNNFCDANALQEIPNKIYRNSQNAYFLVFKMDTHVDLISKAFSSLNKKKVIDVFSSNYLSNKPFKDLEKDEILFFKEIYIAYAKLTEEEIGRIHTVTRDFKVIKDGDIFVFQGPRPEVAYAGNEDWAIRRMHLENVKWTGKGVPVAILDSGLQFSHEQFKERTITSQSFVGRSATDKNGHGTFCTGLLAGDKDGQGYQFGVAKDVKLFIAKVLDTNGYGETVNVLKGIFWALQNNCKILSISIEEPVSANKYLYDRAFKFTLFKGSLCFVPAGNGSRRPNDINTLSLPGSSNLAVTVGAINAQNEIYALSNRAGKGQEIDLVAPGERVYSAKIVRPYGNESYTYDSGTSMAVPLVAGTAALLWEKFPDATADEIKQKLLEMAKREQHWCAEDTGYGVLQCDRELNSNQN